MRYLVMFLAVLLVGCVTASGDPAGSSLTSRRATSRPFPTSA